MADPDVHSLDAAPAEHESLAALVRQLAEQTAALSRQEMRLAQLELRQKTKAAGLGVGLLGAAALLGGFATAAALAAVGAAIAVAVPAWGAALAVAGLVSLVAGPLALLGRGRLSAATPATPVETEQTLRAAAATIKERARR